MTMQKPATAHTRTRVTDRIVGFPDQHDQRHQRADERQRQPLGHPFHGDVDPVVLGQRAEARHHVACGDDVRHAPDEQDKQRQDTAGYC